MNGSGPSRGHQRVGGHGRDDCVQVEDVQPAAGPAPQHRDQDPGRRIQPGHRLLGESATASQGVHGQSTVRHTDAFSFLCLLLLGVEDELDS